MVNLPENELKLIEDLKRVGDPLSLTFLSIITRQQLALNKAVEQRDEVLDHFNENDKPMRESYMNKELQKILNGGTNEQS